MTISGEINRTIRNVIVPTLKDLGFTKFRGRTAWRYLDDSIWVFHIKAVGHYFAQVTGFPPASLTASLGIFYRDFPGTSGVALDTGDQLPIPKEFQCHTRYGLENIEDQTGIRGEGLLPQERNRRDIWWIDSERTNVARVIDDIRVSILDYGVPLLEKPYNSRSIQLERRGLVIPQTQDKSEKTTG